MRASSVGSQGVQRNGGPPPIRFPRPIASMRSIASIAIGAFCNRARSKNFRLRPARGLDDPPRMARRLVEFVEPGVGVCLHQAGIVRQMLFGMLTGRVHGLTARVADNDRRNREGVFIRAIR